MDFCWGGGAPTDHSVGVGGAATQQVREEPAELSAPLRPDEAAAAQRMRCCKPRLPGSTDVNRRRYASARGKNNLILNWPACRSGLNEKRRTRSNIHLLSEEAMAAGVSSGRTELPRRTSGSSVPGASHPAERLICSLTVPSRTVGTLHFTVILNAPLHGVRQIPITANRSDVEQPL